MVSLNVRTHPPVLFAYTPNSADLILKVENTGGGLCWMEADVVLPDRLSLSPDNPLQKGRIRLGIMDRDQSFERNIRIYANNYTRPQMYRCKAIVYTYSREGVIDKRLEKPVDIRCELKKEPVL